MGGEESHAAIGDCDESAGYSGRKCTVCIDDYTRVGKFECSKCPEETENVTILTAMLCGVIIIIGIITRSNIKSAHERKTEIIGVYIRIMTNYFQIISLVNAFELEWPQFVLDYFET